MPAEPVFTRENLIKLMEKKPMAHEEQRVGRTALIEEQVMIETPPRIDIRSALPNDLAIRIWQLDQAMQHLTRNAGVLGVSGNMVQQSLREEKNQIIVRLQSLAPEAEAA